MCFLGLAHRSDFSSSSTVALNRRVSGANSDVAGLESMLLESSLELLGTFPRRRWAGDSLGLRWFLLPSGRRLGVPRLSSIGPAAARTRSWNRLRGGRFARLFLRSHRRSRTWLPATGGRLDLRIHCRQSRGLGGLWGESRRSAWGMQFAIARPEDRG